MFFDPLGLPSAGLGAKGVARGPQLPAPANGFCNSVLFIGLLALYKFKASELK